MRFQSCTVFALLGFLKCSLVESYASFLNRIPNGNAVTHPCYPETKWKGVGHLNAAGGGKTNAFGVDFAANNFAWTQALCRKDSDNDGMTNGQELGDPSCVWTSGSTPYRTANISHPGVCNPCGSAACNATNLIFGSALYVYPEFRCPTASGSDFFTKDYRLNLTKVPPAETTYICQVFKIDSNESWYMVANEPIVNNTNVMHHMLGYGCSRKPKESSFAGPYECIMPDEECGALSAIWGPGYYGECLSPNISVKFGPNSYEYILIQLHWNNPTRSNAMWDNSGLKFHFSKTPRQFEAGMMMIGQNYLELPPGLASTNVTSDFISNYTSLVFGAAKVPTIYITQAVSHMHMRGRYSSIELYRNGAKVNDIFPYQEVRYENPPILILPHMQVHAGDQIKMVCTYSTVGDKSTVYYGESTNHEMCFGFLRYYPKLAIRDDSLTTFGPYLGNGGFLFSQNFNGCLVMPFLNELYTSLTALKINCAVTTGACQSTCRTYAEGLYNHPCMMGWARKALAYLAKFDATTESLFMTATYLTKECELAIRIENNYVLKNSTSLSGNGNSDNLNPSSQKALLIAGAVIAFALLLVVSVVLLIKNLCFSPPSPPTAANDGYSSKAYATAPENLYSDADNSKGADGRVYRVY